MCYFLTSIRSFLWKWNGKKGRIIVCSMFLMKCTRPGYWSSADDSISSPSTDSLSLPQPGPSSIPYYGADSGGSTDSTVHNDSPPPLPPRPRLVRQDGVVSPSPPPRLSLSVVNNGKSRRVTVCSSPPNSGVVAVGGLVGKCYSAGDIQ